MPARGEVEEHADMGLRVDVGNQQARAKLGKILLNDIRRLGPRFERREFERGSDQRVRWGGPRCERAGRHKEPQHEDSPEHGVLARGGVIGEAGSHGASSYKALRREQGALERAETI